MALVTYTGNNVTFTDDEKLRWIIATGDIRLDASFGRDLLKEEGQTTLRWLCRDFRNGLVDLPGTIIRGPLGERALMTLCYDTISGFWRPGYRHLRLSQQYPRIPSMVLRLH